MDRFLLDFDAPSFKKYRKQLLPFALKFYNKVDQKSLGCMKKHIEFFKAYYPSIQFECYNSDIEFLMYETPEEYINHYEKQQIMFDNMCT